MVRRAAERQRGGGRVGPAILVALLVGGSACSSGEDGRAAVDEGERPEEEVTLSVTPARSRLTEPLVFEVGGLEAGAEVTLEVRSTDSQGTGWSSTTTHRADDTGAVDLDGSPDAEPDPMAPISSMQPVDPGSAPSPYLWSGEPQAFTVAVRVDGEEAASTVVERGVPLGVLADTTTIADEGFSGQLYLSPDGVEVEAPALVLLGGSDGGLPGPLTAATLAAEGHPVLTVAYFQGPIGDDPDLPPTLADVPLEPIADAVTWLADRPEVGAAEVWTMGVSRGSEAALLVASAFPDRVAGAVALVPSNVALCGFPDCSRPAWTLDGAPVPYTTQLDQPSPTDTPGAVIPVERIDGPVLGVCGGADEVWDSCAFAEAIDARLEAEGHPDAHEVIAAPEAGHAIGGLVPYEPVPAEGPEVAAVQAAKARVWPEVLAFLDAHGS
ncbi:acyl-CoA thioester hydrolase/BAAT C-terminal domain-containing protein [Iamia majanohamensis]|uniref:Acyl-CoA thioester hydrolase/BAAT C-terminal domain-containing protein n=1 Tax=Iamia majanohamensis TaxID=467976 RepID=A0AAE9YAS7_9ACTN|nr:acyl-CoA thioester hydrolase/BAAT C-terminal domain-containing protein [Iamia majanohamensis]WCO65582.1 acyl-CoA thioester hydrolase/BAAT C-terminal domain-containing protein [Iamia majanohamensis]